MKKSTFCKECMRPFKRGTDSNRKYWLLLHFISEKLPVKEQTYSADQWHLYMRSRFLGCDDMTLPNGKTMTIPKSTADLDVSEFSTYYDQVSHWAAEHDVWLPE